MIDITTTHIHTHTHTCVYECVCVYVYQKTKRYFSPTIARKCPASINIYMHNKRADIILYCINIHYFFGGIWRVDDKHSVGIYTHSKSTRTRSLQCVLLYERRANRHVTCAYFLIYVNLIFIKITLTLKRDTRPCIYVSLRKNTRNHLNITRNSVSDFLIYFK